jgi:hypothetical protein
MTKKAKKSAKIATPIADNMLSINDIAHEFDLSAMYVRNAIRTGVLATVMVPINPESKTMKHLVERDIVIAWRASRAGHSRRADGRSKFTMYATAEELARVQQLLSDNAIETPIEKAYIKKDDEAEVELKTEPVA